MSDSLVLTGVKDVRKQTGTEMLRRNPKGGGDTFQLKRWWVEGGSSTVYEDATIFDVSTGSGSVKLAIASNMSTNLRIDHDGSFNFAFIGANEVSRAALFTSDMALIEHYVFPAISGGKIMTVTPAGGASRPSAGPSKTLTSVTLSGAAQAGDGDTEVYTASKAGTATDTVFTVTSNNVNDVITSVSDTEFSVVFNDVGSHILTLSGTSVTAAVTKVNTKEVTIV